MSIREDELLSYVVERDIDLVVVQLLETAPAFRRWFLAQVDADIEEESFLGVRHSMHRDSGESDIEIGIQTTTGESHIVLVENKIDASFQELQAERYYERGQNYVDNEGWDAYSVVLIAPANYIGQGERAKFGSVVSYEELVETIEDVDHDGGEFFRDLFGMATSKKASGIDSYWTEELERRLTARSAELPPVGVYQRSNKQLRVESDHPAHPYHVLYNAYFPSDFDGEKAIVRLNLTGRDSGSMSEAEFESLQPILSDQLDTIDDFDSRDRRMDPVKRALWRDDYPTDEAYLSAILDALVELIEAYHAPLVRRRTTETLEYRDGRTEAIDLYRVAETSDRSAQGEANGERAGYWILYGVDPSETDLEGGEFLQLSVPESLTGQGMDDLPITLVPKESGLTVSYD